MPNTCTTTTTGNTTCTDCTGQPGIEFVPPHIINVPEAQWGAGGVSIARLVGNLRITFNVGQCGGIVCGLTEPDDSMAGDQLRMPHAWYLRSQPSGLLLAQPMEYGQLQATAVSISAQSKLRIERNAGVVTYSTAAASSFVSRYVSLLSSYGPLQVAADMYASGDIIQ